MTSPEQITITSQYNPRLRCTDFTATRSDGAYVNYQVADCVIARSDWAELESDILQSLLDLFRLYDEHPTGGKS